MSFKIQLPAKCILGGEYSILNKGIGIVCPFYQYNLSLEYHHDEIKTYNTIVSDPFHSLQIILWDNVVKALSLLGINPQELKGYFKIDCTIPPCSGLGFSAALCAAITEWLISMSWLAREHAMTFALALEDGFHLKSSGIDLAGVTSKKIICYSSTKAVSDLSLAWKPCLYISNSGQKSITRDCMQRVNELHHTSPQKSAAIEDQMMMAAFLIKNALESESGDNMSLLANGLNLANLCFFEWGLVSNKLNEHLNLLKKYAIACKVIGAGYGGHVLSLWQKAPPSSLPFKLVPLF